MGRRDHVQKHLFGLKRPWSPSGTPPTSQRGQDSNRTRGVAAVAGLYGSTAGQTARGRRSSSGSAGVAAVLLCCTQNARVDLDRSRLHIHSTVVVEPTECYGVYGEDR